MRCCIWAVADLSRVSVVYRQARTSHWRICFPDNGEEHGSGGAHVAAHVIALIFALATAYNLKRGRDCDLASRETGCFGYLSELSYVSVLIRVYVRLALASVDSETNNGIYFNRVVAPEGGPEFPAMQSHQDFGGSFGGAGFENFEVFQVAGAIEGAGDYYVGGTESLREIFVHGLGRAQSLAGGMGRR